jgi:glycosyltransferase involved in cell wall biosynthesis
MLKLPPNFLLSLVVPVLNEAEAIPLFLQQVEACLGHLPYEVVFVDDGSTDATATVLTTAAATNPKLAVLTLARNFGKEAALCAGMQAAQGHVVVPLDVDLQDPPELIPAMLKQWQHGYQMVVAVRTERQGDGKFKSRRGASLT